MFNFSYISSFLINFTHICYSKPVEFNKASGLSGLINNGITTQSFSIILQLLLSGECWISVYLLSFLESRSSRKGVRQMIIADCVFMAKTIIFSVLSTSIGQQAGLHHTLGDFLLQVPQDVELHTDSITLRDKFTVHYLVNVGKNNKQAPSLSPYLMLHPRAWKLWTLQLKSAVNCSSLYRDTPLITGNNPHTKF